MRSQSYGIQAANFRPRSRATLEPDSADDGPTQVILTFPDRGRVTGVAIGGKDKDTLYAFCMTKIWKRKIQQHALGAWSPWTKVVPNKL